MSDSDNHTNQAEQLLATYKLVINSIPSRVFWKNKDLVYLGGNSLFAQDAGLSSSEELPGKTDFDLGWATEQAVSFRSDDSEVIATGLPKLNIEEPQDHPDGKTHWLLTNKIPLFDENNNAIGVLGTYTDISERKWHEQMIEFQANFDALTKLPNRHHLQREIKTYIETETVPHAGLFFIDLDYFKTVNDSLGHYIGDLLLKQVANRITKVVGEGVFFARLGGDEFSAFLSFQGKSSQEADAELKALAESIIQALILPFAIEGHEIYLGASIGISKIVSSQDNISDTFREADLAMYSAKDAGRNRYHFISDQIRIAAERDHLLQSHLRHATKKNEFHLVFQPQVDSCGEIIGAEALLRWENKELGVISPFEFIPIAEKTGLIHEIGRWVLHESFRLAASYYHNQQLANFGTLAINISVRQFQNENFVDNIAEIISVENVPANVIELELTESVLLERTEEAIEKLNQLRKLGFSIAIDDFGTGYSSLSYLSRLPINKIKIDQSFTRLMLSDERQATLVKTIIVMAENLGMDVIAEGVECREERDFLLKQGCSKYQGYYYSRPVRAEEFLSLAGKGNIEPQV